MKSVYLINQEGTNFYKIGCTVSGNPIDRLKKLQTGNPNKIILTHVFEVDDPRGWEKFLHNDYESFSERLNGEWFVLSPENIETIVQLLSIPMENWKECCKYRQLIPHIPSHIRERFI